MVNVKEIILGLIIAIVLLMFLVYGIKLVYDKPERDCYADLPKPLGEEGGEEQVINLNECRGSYEESIENYTKNLFIISLIIGVVIVLVSIIGIKIESISGGLMFGSLMFIIYGTSSYWGYMDDWLRFFILGIALLILIYGGYWLSKKK